MALFFEVKIDIKSDRFLELNMSSEWSRREAPKPPINRLKIKLLFGIVVGCIGRRPTLIFDDTLHENKVFLSAPWYAFWSVLGANMRSRCGPRWRANVAKILWPKLV